MPDILRVTTPVTNHENAVRPRPDAPNPPALQNIPDPNRVTQANQQNVYTELQQNKFSALFESNYDKFLQLLRSTPGMTETYAEVFFTKLGNFVNAGINENFAEEIAQYMQFLEMEPSELLEFFKSQCDSAVKFGGPFFGVLRELLSSNFTSTKEAMLDLLRKFDSLVSNPHILKEITTNLQNIARYMPKQSAEQLLELVSQLREHPDGHNSANLNLLKGQILPFLGEYISQSHDFGSIRDFITMFTLNLARYESGSVESFEQAFQNAMAHPEIAEKFSGLTADDFRVMFLNTNPTPAHQEALDKFVQIISGGIKGEAGVGNIPNFENILKSMLINESVYMPLLHVTLPANIDGSMLFSEIWIDPEAERSEGSSSDESSPKERAIKMLIKVDVKNVGYFEMILLYFDDKVDLQLYYPPSLDHAKDEIRAGIREITARNALNLQSFISEKVEKPKAISEVFPKIYERKNAINVTV